MGSAIVDEARCSAGNGADSRANRTGAEAADRRAGGCAAGHDRYRFPRRTTIDHAAMNDPVVVVVWLRRIGDRDRRRR